ncbi:MAG: hypothetical protein KF814_04310 [Nitrospiraceae bacterium]|nr:hypothetical protein [Nitrospiraceae bacterium]
MPMRPLDQPVLEQLMQQLRGSMRSLLFDLCRDFSSSYPGDAKRLGLPIDWFQNLVRALPLKVFNHWKIVGWIESLNDLLYFVDVREQVRAERDRHDVASQLHAEFQDKFYENSYADEVFPKGRPEPQRLLPRLDTLCRRLARECIQESLWLVPEAACRWIAGRPGRTWQVPCDFGADMERVELACSLAAGLEGQTHGFSKSLQHALKRASLKGRVTVRPSGIDLTVRGSRVSLFEAGAAPRWSATLRAPVILRRTRYGDLTLGPTLVYDRQRIPTAVRPSPSSAAPRIRLALQAIEAAWPEGNDWLALFTSRICPLRAKGVVSFSYRHRPGLSVINCFDRDNLDLIDDLIHENSHHHLNLLLRKYAMYGGDHNQEIFYSPWRRSLRPIRGILHATFTFTMGALLFERLSSWAESPAGRRGWKATGLTARDLRRARFRCFEEIESVRYSLQDLAYAGDKLKWLTASGRHLTQQLCAALDAAEKRIEPYRRAVLKSEFGPALRGHIKELGQARGDYGPMGKGRGE